MDWERRYREGDTPWDKGEASPGLVEFLQQQPLAGSVLVPGCGMGHDVRAIAGQGGIVTGIDLAPTAIATAKQFPSVNREQYELLDFFQLPDRLSNQFDWVFEHTCFCAVDVVLRWQYVNSVVKALKPGGFLLAVFYINPAPDRGGPPYRVSSPQLDKLFGPYFITLKEWQPLKAYPHRIGRERMRLMQLKERPLNRSPEIHGSGG